MRRLNQRAKPINQDIFNKALRIKMNNATQRVFEFLSHLSKFSLLFKIPYKKFSVLNFVSCKSLINH